MPGSRRTIRDLMRTVLAVILTCIACKTAEKPVDNTNEQGQEFSSSPSPPPLHELPGVRSRFNLPPDYERARELFDVATTAYDDGNPEAAAPKFLQVASLLRTKDETTYAEGFRQM